MKSASQLLSVVSSILLILSASPVRADDSAATAVKNDASDAKTSVKKNWRKGKRKARKAAGTDTVGKDVKDSTNDVGDDVNNAAKKTKNKINQ